MPTTHQTQVFSLDGSGKSMVGIRRTDDHILQRLQRVMTRGRSFSPFISLFLFLHSLSRSRSLAISLSLSLRLLTRSLVLFLFISHFLSLPFSFARSISISLARARSLSLSLSISLSRCLPHSLYLALACSIARPFALDHTLVFHPTINLLTS